MISYSGLTNYGKITLPSVDSWGDNMNILRDPPKSIHTRRIDKVGQTSDITSMVDDSSDRACEAINVYARGVNPSVSVSYSNHGNSGISGSLAGLSRPIAGLGSQAKLPYTILKDGAFRPPIRTEYDLLPLSRQPRVWTSAFSKPGFVDFSKKLRTCGTAEETKEVHNNIINMKVRPTATYKIEKPISEPFEVKYVIQPTITRSVTSGMRTMDIKQRSNKKPTKEIFEHTIHAAAISNKNDKSKFVRNKNRVKTERYIQHTSHSDCNTQIKGSEKIDYIHKDLTLDRKMPVFSNRTNNGDTRIFKRSSHENNIVLNNNKPSTNYINTKVEKKDNLSSRDYKLIPKIKPEGFESRPSRQPVYRDNNVKSFESQKANIDKKVFRSMQDRFSGRTPPPWAK